MNQKPLPLKIQFPASAPTVEIGLIVKLVCDVVNPVAVLFRNARVSAQRAGHGLCTHAGDVAREFCGVNALQENRI